MFYSSAWCLKNESDLEKNVPLLLLGDSLVKLGSRERLKLLILEGYCLLSTEYIRALGERNIDAIDFTDEFSKIVGRFSNISSYYNRFERNCFLRWVAFKEFRESSGDTSQFFHLDSDVYMHISLEELEAKTRGLNFMTLGCPAFISASDQEWLNIFESEIIKLEKNIKGYLVESGSNLEKCRQNDFESFNLSLFHDTLHSDQDFLEFLVSSNRLPHSPYQEIVGTGLYFIQNPLMLDQMRIYLKTGEGMIEEGPESSLFYQGRKIPFIHYQGAFCLYIAALFIALHRLQINSRLIAKCLLRYELKFEELKIPLTSRIFLKIIKKLMSRPLNRKTIIEELMHRYKGALMITELLNIIDNREK